MCEWTIERRWINSFKVLYSYYDFFFPILKLNDVRNAERNEKAKTLK